MSTFAFAGTTLWNDASTGVNQVRVTKGVEMKRTVLEPVPRAGGYIAKSLGSEPSAFTIECEYILSSAEVDSLEDTIRGKNDSTGTVTFPPSESVSYCRLLGASYQKGPPCQTSAGTAKYFYVYQFVFQSLRAA